MNQSVKIFLIAIATCVLTVGLMLLLDLYILVRLGDWTMATVNKFLVHEWTTLDKNLVRWFPLFIGLIIVLKKRNPKQYLKTVLWSTASIIIWITIGVIIGLLTWSRGTGYASLMPSYVKYQPFQNYWTVFIVIGILLPLLLQLMPKKRRIKSSELIDK